MNRTKNRKFFYGWVIVFACVLLSAASTGLLSYFNALFIVPVTTDFGVSRTSFTLYSSISTFTTMLLIPFFAPLFKKYSIKALIFIGGLLGAGAHICYSFSQSVYGFYVGGLLAGLAVCFFGTIPMTMLLSNWFHAKRGLVTGIAFTGSGISSSLLSSTVESFIQEHGWRFAYRTISLSIMLVIIIALLLIREKPEDMGLTPYGDQPGAVSDTKSVGFVRKSLFGMPMFWIFAAALFIMSFITMGTQNHIVAYWTENGVNGDFATNMYSVVLLVGVASKVLLGGLYDKLGVAKASIISCLISVSALLSLSFLTDGYWVIVPAVLFGITTSIQVIASPHLTSILFGEKDYPENVSISTTCSYLGITFGVSFSSVIYDNTGSYLAAWFIYAALMLLDMVALLAANRMSKKAFKNILGIERDG